MTIPVTISVSLKKKKNFADFYPVPTPCPAVSFTVGIFSRGLHKTTKLKQLTSPHPLSIAEREMLAINLLTFIPLFGKFQKI